MNEKIKELALQSNFCQGSIDYDATAIEKFAELIIQACISACATDRLGKTVGVEECITEYFGIE